MALEIDGDLKCWSISIIIIVICPDRFFISKNKSNEIAVCNIRNFYIAPYNYIEHGQEPYFSWWTETKYGLVDQDTVAWQAPMLLVMPLLLAHIYYQLNNDIVPDKR